MITLKTACKSILFLAAILMFASPLLVQASPLQEDNKELKELYAQLDKAVKEKKLDPMVSVLADDYKYQTLDGKTLNNKQAMQLFEQMFATLETVQEAVTKIEKVEETEDGLTVTVKQTLKGTIMGQDGKPHELASVSVSTDKWVETEKGWKLAATTTIEDKSTIDGKPIQ
jgi:ketosteroid isomerase-like protein